MATAKAKRPNIIVIDDEELTQELIRHMLRELEIGEIAIFSSCSKALSRIKKDGEHFDLIISDWEVPGLNGLDFLKEFRKIQKETPFLMVTGNASKELVVNAMKAGVTAFIAKPFTANSLLQKVTKLTGAKMLEKK
ncbi:MAG: response regulator [Alteromonadaceae bacterium]|nr:response regulator [Alteromonadaceae bacterium]